MCRPERKRYVHEEGESYRNKRASGPRRSGEKREVHAGAGVHRREGNGAGHVDDPYHSCPPEETLYWNQHPRATRDRHTRWQVRTTTLTEATGGRDDCAVNVSSSLSHTLPLPPPAQRGVCVCGFPWLTSRFVRCAMTMFVTSCRCQPGKSRPARPQRTPLHLLAR